MTRDDIIRMTREAGLDQWDGTSNHFASIMERFAALVAAAERERVAAWMLARSYATGHGDTVEDLLNELEWQVAEREREACAKVCEELPNTFKIAADEFGYTAEQPTAENYAAAIRTRSDE
jgi:hypothetical protein